MFNIVCANPVIDFIYHNYGASVGNRHFFESFYISAGGFGPNTARALACCGVECRCLLTAGGATGWILKSSLQREGIAFEETTLTDDTRVASIRCGMNDTQMLVSPSPSISTAHLAELFVKSQNSSSKLSDVCLIGGSVPPSLEPAYLQHIKDVCNKSVCCCDVRTSRWRELVSAQPTILKIHDSDDSANTSLETRLVDATNNGVKYALCSTQSHVVMARAEGRTYRVTPPTLSDPIVNEFGAGDCLLAVFALGISVGKSTRSALVEAVASASASVLTPIPGLFDSDLASRLSKYVNIVCS